MTRVTMPAMGYHRPDRLDAAGLVVSVIGTDGKEAGPFDFSLAPAHGRRPRQMGGGAQQSRCIPRTARPLRSSGA